MKKPTVELILSATRASWSVSTNHGTESDKDKRLPKELREKILKRDDYTCQGCLFRSLRFQEIHHRDSDHRNYDENNLTTLCPLCHQVFHLPLAATTMGGTIIWLPEISQADINRLCIGILSVPKSQPKSRYFGVSRALFGAMEGRKSFVDKLGSNDPGVVAQMLINMTPKQYKERHEIVQHLRLLPTNTRFEEQASYWASEKFNNFEESKISSIVSKIDIEKLKNDK